jgi:AcrR family transcriptional regulator
MINRVFTLPPTHQARSRATQARFVEAANRLLERRAWDQISIEDIVEEADLSIGAFYKRFRAKDDVLAAYVETALEEGRAQAVKMLAIESALSQRVRALVEMLAKGWNLRANVVRAAKALRSETHIEALRAESASTQSRIAAWLLERRAEFRHPNPDTAVAMAFNLPLSALQAALMDPYCSCEVRETLIAEATHMLAAYFGCAD